MNNQPIKAHKSFIFYVVQFPFQAVFTAALCEKQMPRDNRTGKFVLESVKEDQRARLATRTVEALARLQESGDRQESSDIQEDSDSPSDRGETSETSANPYHAGEVTWIRHVFGAWHQVKFSRGTEVITCRRAPIGDPWFIVFGNPPQPPTQPE